MGWKKSYQNWKQNSKTDQTMIKQLEEIENRPEELIDCFSGSLKIKRNGIDGYFGPGPNRLNKYTIRKLSKSIALYSKSIEIKEKVSASNGIVIAYDRHKESPALAVEAARTLGKHGIKTYLFKSIEEPAALNFAVSYLGALGGLGIYCASESYSEGLAGISLCGPAGCELRELDIRELTQGMQKFENEFAIEVADERDLFVNQLLDFIEGAPEISEHEEKAGTTHIC
ncbi:hypothetical protein [Bacillus marinisedimentorum]|uniref:hypothetical protein n=1 Tax=Bacillus marinisedimentorum TaxID=1821260 RepID=UPI0007E193D3|nr:hypothetical protein [Bacillus marinisedimentorum]